MINKFVYTWDFFEEDVTKLLKLIEYGSYDMLIRVVTGGLPLLTKIHNATKIPYEIVKCSSYDEETKKFFHMEFGIPFIGGKKVLVLDDVSDTGETLQKVVEKCRELGTKDIVVDTATLCVKTGTTFWPNWYGRIVEKYDWIHFAWE